ncbi:MAG: dephospho-CoA kinase [Bacteroidetes bacterium]|nr:dephospho-CoA kinase [Bacteroidota bacterium]
MKSIVIGLTGGIGCGKSVVASLFENLGAEVIDADLIGKQVVESSPLVLNEIVDAFGKEFLDGEGRLKRKELGNFVFASEERRLKLNEIVHPHLWAECENRIVDAKKRLVRLIVVDAALIYETALDSLFDGVLVVTASLENRISRLKSRDGLTEDAINHRIRSQMPIEEKEKRATWVLRNDAGLDLLEEKVIRLHRTILQIN